jgi:hypothetical protein
MDYSLLLAIEKNANYKKIRERAQTLLGATGVLGIAGSAFRKRDLH